MCPWLVRIGRLRRFAPLSTVPSMTTMSKEVQRDKGNEDHH